MEFTNAEFAVLDLASEDAELLGHFVYLVGADPKADEVVSVLSGLIRRELLVLYARRDDDEPLTQQAALGALSDLGPLTDDGTGRWWQLYATTTAAGDDAYRRAYDERS